MTKRPHPNDGEEREAKRQKREQSQLDLPGPFGVTDMTRQIARHLDSPSRHSLALTCSPIYTALVCQGKPCYVTWLSISDVTARLGYAKLLVYWIRNGCGPTVRSIPFTVDEFDRLVCDAMRRRALDEIAIIGRYGSRKTGDHPFDQRIGDGGLQCIKLILAELDESPAEFAAYRAELRIWLQRTLGLGHLMQPRYLVRQSYTTAGTISRRTADMAVEAAVGDGWEGTYMGLDFLGWLEKDHDYTTPAVTAVFDVLDVLMDTPNGGTRIYHSRVAIVRYFAHMLGRKDRNCIDDPACQRLVAFWNAHICPPWEHRFEILRAAMSNAHTTVPFYQWPALLPGGFAWFEDEEQHWADVIFDGSSLPTELAGFLAPDALARTVRLNPNRWWIAAALGSAAPIARPVWRALIQNYEGTLTGEGQVYPFGSVRNAQTVLNFFKEVPLDWLSVPIRCSHNMTSLSFADEEDEATTTTATIPETTKNAARLRWPHNSVLVEILCKSDHGGWPTAIAHVLARRLTVVD